MSQFDFGNLESPLSGTELINNNLEPWRDALHSGHMGPTRPSYAIEGLHWIDNSSTPWILKVFTGSDDTSLGTIDPATNIYAPAGVSQDAESVTYDNAESDLSADNVQDAIDEAYGNYDAFANRVDGFATAAQGALAGTALQPGDATKLTLSATVNTTTGTAIDFNSLPAGIKKVTMKFAGVSTTGTSPPIIQLGDSGGIETTGYVGSTYQPSAGVLWTVGAILVRNTSSAIVFHGNVDFELLESSTNTWSISGVIGRTDAADVIQLAGSKALSATLDRLRLTTEGGANTFDAGKASISYWI